MIGFAAERLMEMEVGGRTGAEWGEKSEDRPAPCPSIGLDRAGGVRIPTASTKHGIAHSAHSCATAGRDDVRSRECSVLSMKSWCG